MEQDSRKATAQQRSAQCGWAQGSGARAGSGARLYPLCEWAQERRAAGLRGEEQRDAGEKSSAMQGKRIATRCNPRGGGVAIRQESDVGLNGGRWRMMDASH
jgi:hypothetical protein